MQLRRKERKLPHGARIKEPDEKHAKSFSNDLQKVLLELSFSLSFDYMRVIEVKLEPSFT